MLLGGRGRDYEARNMILCKYISGCLAFDLQRPSPAPCRSTLVLSRGLDEPLG